MKLNVTKKTLVEALSVLERIIPARSSSPLLRTVRVDATKDTLLLSGTNLEVDLQLAIPAEVAEPGVFAAPAHLLSQIVKSLPGELVEWRHKEGNLDIRSAGSKSKLQTTTTEGLPDLTFQTEGGFTMPADALALALSRVRYAVTGDAYQAVFRGIKLEIRDGFIQAVASDGYRLALHKMAASVHPSESLIIPGRSVDEMLRVLRGGEVRFIPGGTGLSLVTERAKMNVRLMDGDFPDYTRVIPKDLKITAVLSGAAFKEAVARVGILADKNANNRIEIALGDGKMLLRAEGDYGTSEDELTVTLSGAESAMMVPFNARYLAEALGQMEGDVVFSMSGTTAPAVLTPLSGDGSQAVCVALRDPQK